MTALHRLTRLHRHRATLTAGLVIVGGLLLPAVAQADSVSLRSDPDAVEGTPFRIFADYSVSNPGESLYVTIKTFGGAGCQANFSADENGSSTVDDGNESVEGAGTVTNQVTESRGSYLVCAYEQRNSDETTTDSPVQSLRINVRQAHATLAISAPATASTNIPFQVTPSYAVEQPRELFVSDERVVPGTSCPAAFSLLTGGASTLIDGDGVQGAGSDVQKLTLPGPGTYLLCGWVQMTSTDESPAAEASTVVTVPPPNATKPKPKAVSRCTNQRRTVASDQARLARARGAQRRHPSASHRRMVRSDEGILARARANLGRCQR